MRREKKPLKLRYTLLGSYESWKTWKVMEFCFPDLERDESSARQILSAGCPGSVISCSGSRTSWTKSLSGYLNVCGKLQYKMYTHLAKPVSFSQCSMSLGSKKRTQPSPCYTRHVGVACHNFSTNKLRANRIDLTVCFPPSKYLC